MAPDPLPATSAAVPPVAMPTANPAGSADGNARREPSSASFAGNLQAALTQAAKAAGAPMTIPITGAGPDAIGPVANGTAMQAAASPILVAGPTAPPVSGAGIVAAAPAPQDRVAAGKPRSTASPAAPVSAKPAGPEPADAHLAGLPIPDLVVVPAAVPQPPILPALLKPVAVDAVTIAASRSRFSPPTLADNAPAEAELAVPRADAAYVGALVAAMPTNTSETTAFTAAVASPVEATMPGLAMSAAVAAPAVHFEKPGPPDTLGVAAGIRESSLAQQIAPALLSLANVGLGTQRLTLRLDPTVLGQVEIRIDRPALGPAEIRIVAERPETLVLLQHDRHQLEQALDQAGIPAGRQIEFQVASRVEPGAGHAAAGSSDASGDGTAGRDGFGSGGRHGDDNRHGRADQAAAETSARVQNWLRAGVDITA